MKRKEPAADSVMRAMGGIPTRWTAKFSKSTDLAKDRIRKIEPVYAPTEQAAIEKLLAKLVLRHKWSGYKEFTMWPDSLRRIPMSWSHGKLIKADVYLTDESANEEMDKYAGNKTVRARKCKKHFSGGGEGVALAAWTVVVRSREELHDPATHNKG